MQKDFHYCVIKLLAVKAGFNQEQAQVIAYASQYVDDATDNSKFFLNELPDNIKFERYQNKMFKPLCTAHKDFLDYLESVSPACRRKVHMSFHFVPDKDKSLDYRVKSNGELANKLVDFAVKELKKSINNRNLIKFGIALHSYADQWSHQGFSGDASDENDIKSIQIKKNGNTIDKELTGKTKTARALLGLIGLGPIGHMMAENLPDQSHLDLKFSNHGRSKNKNNVKEFMKAAFEILKKMLNAKKSEEDPKKIWGNMSKDLEYCLSLNTNSRGKIAEYGKTKFTDISFYYDPKKWKSDALGEDCDYEGFDFENEEHRKYRWFQLKDPKWVYFHIEALNQRKFVMNSL